MPTMNMEPISQGKTSLSVSPKNKSELIKPSADLDELSHWAQLYYQVHVIGSPEKTIEAKTYDLKLFLDFFSIQVGADQNFINQRRQRLSFQNLISIY